MTSCSPTPCVLATVPVGASPFGVAYDGASGEVLVANSGSNNVSVISDTTNTVVVSAPTGTTPGMVAYDRGNGDFYVTLTSNNVSVISGSTDRLVATVTVGTAPFGVAYDSGNGDVYVANEATDNVSVISGTTNRVVATVPVGTSPFGLAYDAGTGEVFVANTGTNNVSVISDATNRVVATVPVGTSPIGVAYDSGKAEVFVANANCATSPCGSGTGWVSVISDSNDAVVSSIPVGTFPVGVAYDLGTGQVFVTNMVCLSTPSCGPGSVSVISDSNNTLAATVSVGSRPFGVAYDPGDREVYVADSSQNAVSIISAGTSGPIISSFTASPSPIRTGWTTFLNVSASGGTGVFSYAYAGLPPGCLSANVNSLVCRPTSTGAFSPRAYANDTSGGRATATTSLTVTTGPSPTLSTVSVSPSSAPVPRNGSATFATELVCSGGACPAGATYQWSLTNALGTLSATTGATTTFTAGSRLGSDTLFVNVTLGSVTRGASATVTVQNTTSPRGGGSGWGTIFGLPALEVLGTIGLLALAGIAGVVATRRRGRRSGANPPEAPDSKGAPVREPPDSGAGRSEGRPGGEVIGASPPATFDTPRGGATPPSAPSSAPPGTAPPLLRPCPSCGAGLEPNAAFCPECGAKAPLP